MSYEVLEKAYNSLSAERQKNVEQFICFLVEQQKMEDAKISSMKCNRSSDFESVLDSFVGCTHAWDGTDVMDYQHKLRGEYRVD